MKIIYQTIQLLIACKIEFGRFEPHSDMHTKGFKDSFSYLSER